MSRKRVYLRDWNEMVGVIAAISALAAAIGSLIATIAIPELRKLLGID